MRRTFCSLRGATLGPAIMAMIAVAAAQVAPHAASADGSPPAVGEMSRGGVKAPRLLAVIDRTDIRMSGLTNVRELLLSRAAYNSFGLSRPFVLGIGRAAVLVNGRRLSDSTLDLDTLPVSAVERIEILDEGAARHGGHAIAGTVNIVLRRGHEGAEIQADLSRPGQAGGDSHHASALWGGALGRGHLTIGADHIRRQEVRDADRDYSRAEWTPGGSFADTQGVSVGGNTAIIVPTGENSARAGSIGGCDRSVYTGVLTEPLNVAGTGCGFAYADVKWHDGYGHDSYDRRERESLFLNADHPLDDDTDMYVNARAAQEETAFRYAPSVGDFTFSPSSALRQQLAADLGIPAGEFPDEIIAFHRFVGHGNRDWRTDLDEYDLTLGLRGRLGANLGYDAHVRYYRHEAVEKGDTFVSESAVRTAIENGDYDIENPLSTAPGHLQAIRETGLRLTRDLVTDYRTAHAALEGAAFALPGGDVRWTAGIEVADEDWQDIYDYRDSGNRFHEATDVLGSAGNSAAGERRRWAALADASVPLLASWDLDLAARRDDYDDVGETISWQVANRYRLNDALALRASWSGGGSPPGLGDLHALETLDHPRICDTSQPDCTRRQVTRAGVGNPDLKPDQAQSVGVGATMRLGAFSFGADWFKIEISDHPAQLSPQSIVDLDVAGNLPPGARVVRDGGHITRIVSPLYNSGETEVAGIELRVGTVWETDLAELSLDIRGLRTTGYEVRVAGQEQPSDYPRDRVHASLRASRGGVTASWSFHNEERSGRYGTWTGHDVALLWRGAFGIDRLDLAGGVLNVGDRGPSTAGPDDSLLRLDSVMGRTLFLNATLSFDP